MLKNARSGFTDDSMPLDKFHSLCYYNKAFGWTAWVALLERGEYVVIGNDSTTYVTLERYPVSG
jgi:hypothetical protein